MDTKNNVGLIMKLPINYQIQYVKIKTDSDSNPTPLDLTATTFSKKIMLSSPLKKRYIKQLEENLNEEKEETSELKPNLVLSPLKKRYRGEENEKIESFELERKSLKTPEKAKKPESINKRSSKNQQQKPLSAKDKKSKSIRKLKFDEYASSPVSGTIIRPLEEISVEDSALCGDIPEQFNIVEITEEAKQELSMIPK
jgi:hypothetical protein